MGMWLATVLLLAALIAIPFAINIPIRRAAARRSESTVDMDEGTKLDGVKLVVWGAVNTLLWAFTGAFGLVYAIRLLRTQDIRARRKFAFTARLWNIVGSVVGVIILLANVAYNS